MSRLTASPFHKPSPFEFPRVVPFGLPPSPPETHAETVTVGPSPAQITSAGAQEYFHNDTPLANSSPDTAGTRFRKSSIQYHSTGVRDNRERPPHRSNKSLIIAIPPATLIQVHGQHGHTISNGPYHRLSHGVVMPLFPSMFGQLTAIAREFNFPSITGLCLYFHYVEEGITMMPRISDESWPTLWSHLSDPLPINDRRPLIGGKVEFDIDIRLARWYPSWVSALHRETSDHIIHQHPSTTPSLAHFRGESRTTAGDGRPSEDEVVENSALSHATPISRHVPRKLSLVERFDISSSRQEIRAGSQANTPPDNIPSGSQVLTTIMQEEEPPTARQDLASRVKSWRASALITPTALAASGQTSLDPSNLPNNIDPSSPVEEEQELNLEDFTWSVSSMGPKSFGEVSPLSWSPSPSIDLARRMEGSVCTTASYCTSTGPLDYGPLSPMSWGYTPSVDLGHRMAGSVCSTASYHTSSGPSDYNPISPVLDFSYLATPDVAHRFFYSTPSTPATATTWGPPLSYPPSPRCSSPTPSLDMGERSMYDTYEAPRHHHPRSTPIDSAAASNAALSAQKIVDTWKGQPWAHVWPYNRKALPRSSVWKRITASRVIEFGVDKPIPNAISSMSEVTVKTQKILDRWSDRPWSHVWPYNKDRTHSKTQLVPSSGWKRVNISTVIEQGTLPEAVPSHWTFGYPYLILYAPVYPYLDIYPGIPGEPKMDPLVSREEGCISVKAPAVYPFIDLYPAVYPYNLDNIYQPVVKSLGSGARSEGYPYFNIYPAKNVHFNAHFALYLSNPRSQYPNFELYPGISTHEEKATSHVQSIHLQVYPTFNLYPAIYPFFVIYPAIDIGSKISENTRVQTQISAPGSEYPNFNLYPAVYPFFDLYLPVDLQVKPMASSIGVSGSRLNGPETGYPTFNLYPPVYPYFDLYPAPYFEATSSSMSSNERGLLSVAVGLAYPSFNFYPSLYPYLNIYPVPYFSGAEKIRESQFSSVGYPHFNLYPGKESSRVLKDMPPVTAEVRYPIFNLYPAIYPYFNLYPSSLQSLVPPQTQTLRKPKSSRLTHAELHAMVMMERVSSTGSFDAIQSMNRLDADRRVQEFRQVHSNESLPTRTSETNDILRRPSLAFKSGSFLQSIGEGSDSSPGPSLSRRPSTQRSGDPRASYGLPARPSPKRRDSLVLQRVKAFDANVEISPVHSLLTKENLAKFPTPPKAFPPLPPIPLDRGF